MNLGQNVPSIASSAHTHSIYDGAVLSGQGLAYANATLNSLAASRLPNQTVAAPHFQKGNTMPSRRLVQVVIVDPNENISLEDCLLFKGEEKLTDATDQELFFELDIKEILEKHNKKRALVIDKKVKDRTEYLEPAKIRDLKMVVVNIASF